MTEKGRFYSIAELRKQSAIAAGSAIAGTRHCRSCTWAEASSGSSLEIDEWGTALQVTEPSSTSSQSHESGASRKASKKPC